MQSRWQHSQKVYEAVRELYDAYKGCENLVQRCYEFEKNERYLQLWLQIAWSTRNVPEAELSSRGGPPGMSKFLDAVVMANDVNISCAKKNLKFLQIWAECFKTTKEEWEKEMPDSENSSQDPLMGSIEQTLKTTRDDLGLAKTFARLTIAGKSKTPSKLSPSRLEPGTPSKPSAGNGNANQIMSHHPSNRSPEATNSVSGVTSTEAAKTYLELKKALQSFDRNYMSHKSKPLLHEQEHCAASHRSLKKRDTPSIFTKKSVTNVFDEAQPKPVTPLPKNVACDTTAAEPLRQRQPSSTEIDGRRKPRDTATHYTKKTAEINPWQIVRTRKVKKTEVPTPIRVIVKGDREEDSLSLSPSNWKSRSSLLLPTRASDHARSAADVATWQTNSSEAVYKELQNAGLIPRGQAQVLAEEEDDELEDITLDSEYGDDGDWSIVSGDDTKLLDQKRYPAEEKIVGRSRVRRWFRNN
jgi:hypothetical protein